MSANERYLLDRSWMDRRIPKTGPGVSTEFENGVETFLDFAFKHGSAQDGLQIRCPCRKCVHLYFKDRDNVTYDLYTKGFAYNYKRWVYHGEPDLLPGQTSASVQAEVQSKENDGESDLLQGQTSASAQAKVQSEKTWSAALGSSCTQGKSRVVKSGMNRQISLILSRYRRIRRAKACGLGGGASIDEATLGRIANEVEARMRAQMSQSNIEQIRKIAREMILGTASNVIPPGIPLMDIIRAEVRIVCTQIFEAYLEAMRQGHVWPQGAPSGSVAGSEPRSESQSESESSDVEREPSSPPSSP